MGERGFAEGRQGGSDHDFVRKRDREEAREVAREKGRRTSSISYIYRERERAREREREREIER